MRPEKLLPWESLPPLRETSPALSTRLGDQLSPQPKFFLASELAHLLKNIFKVFKVMSFLDWMVGALARKLRECSLVPQEISLDLLGVLFLY